MQESAVTTPIAPLEAAFTVSYQGSALVAHTMPVRELAPALLALGQAFDRANGIFNGNLASVSLEVRATQPGSFEIALLLRTLYDQTTGIFSGDFVTSAANLKELFFSSSGIPTILSVIKRAKGKAVPPPLETTPSVVTLEIDGLRLSVPTEVYRARKTTYFAITSKQ